MTTITIDRAVVERALELLGTWAKPPARLYRVMDNLRAALAQQDEPVEQVAWRLWDEDPQGGGDWRYYDAKDFKEGIDPMKYFDGLVPLYLAPPQRKPLTSDKDRPDQGATYVAGYGYVDTRAVRAIERAHGIVTCGDTKERA